MRSQLPYLLYLLLLGTSHHAISATAYHGFTLLDPVSKTVTQDAYVVVEGERIVRVGRGPAPRHDDWKYVAMPGRFALPGFFDAHAHLTSGPLSVSVKNGSVSLDMTS